MYYLYLAPFITAHPKILTARKGFRVSHVSVNRCGKGRHTVAEAHFVRLLGSESQSSTDKTIRTQSYHKCSVFQNIISKTTQGEGRGITQIKVNERQCR